MCLLSCVSEVAGGGVSLAPSIPRPLQHNHGNPPASYNTPNGCRVLLCCGVEGSLRLPWLLPHIVHPIPRRLILIWHPRARPVRWVGAVPSPVLGRARRPR